MILVSRESPDHLTQETWGFVLIDEKLVLDTYTKGVKPTKRHKPVRQVYYSRLNSRDAPCPEAEVPWREDVNAEALAQLLALFKVGRWKADFGRR
jgi:hypothetical protein